MHSPLSFSGLGQWLSQAFAKSPTATPPEKVASIGCDNVINSELIHAFSRGSEPAFRGIYDHYAPAIYRVSLRYFQSGQLAEDLVSEVFTALWYRRSTFFEPAEVKLFLFTKAKSIALKYLARMKESRS